MTAAATDARGGAGPHLALIAVQIFFGSWPVFGKIALRVIPAAGIVAIRTLGATVAFLILDRILGVGTSVEKSDLKKIALYSLLGVVFNQILYTKGLELSTVANVSLISTVIPVAALIIGVMMGLDTLSLAKTFGVLLAAAGVIYLIDPFRADVSSSTTLGNIFVVGNTLSYAAYIAISKPVFKKYGALAVITWVFIFGSVITVPAGAYSIAHAPLSEADWKIWLSLVYIILFPTIGSYYLNAWALARVPPSTVAVYIYLQPIVAITCSALILSEHINPRAWIASALIFAGVFFVSRIRPGRGVAHVTTP